MRAPEPARADERSLLLPLAEFCTVRETAWQELGRLVRREATDGAMARLRIEAGMSGWVEWRKLRIVRLHDAGTNADDARSGITRRYWCLLRSEAHRVWWPDRGCWSAWRDGSHPAFPTQVEVTCRVGRWSARATAGAAFTAPAATDALPPRS